MNVLAIVFCAIAAAVVVSVLACAFLKVGLNDDHAEENGEAKRDE